MNRWVINRFDDGSISDDGGSVSLTLHLAGGGTSVWEIQFEQLDWVIQALLVLANGAYARQADLGRLREVGPAVTHSFEVESSRVLVNLNEHQTLVQLMGRRGEAEVLGAGAFTINAENARSLGNQLLAAADELEGPQWLS